MRFLILLLVAMTLFSCKKERTIQIIAKNPVTGERYTGLTYYVVQEMTSGDGENFKTVATGSLNSNGEVTLTKKFSKKYSYVVRVEQPANICYNKQISQSFGSPYDVDGTFTFEFAECAYLKLHVHNTNCINTNDEIQFRRLWLTANESNSFVIQNGCFQFDGDYFSLPMGEYKYEWTVLKNGVSNSYDSTFTLSENQYFDFTINY